MISNKEGLSLLIYRYISTAVLAAFMVLLTTANAVYAEQNQSSFMLGVNSLDSTLSVYQLTSQGTVRHQGFYPTAKNPKAVAVHPSGSFAYVVAKTANKLMAYQVVTENGRLDLRNPVPYDVHAMSPFSLTIHPSGKFLYVAAREGKIAAYHIDLQTGLLTPLPSSPFTTQYRTRSLVVHGSGKYLYAVNAYANSISAFHIDTVSGALSPLPNSPYSVVDADIAIRSLYPLADVPAGAGGMPYYVALDPQGRFLYVSNWGAGKIAAFRVDQRTGSLSHLPGSPYDTGLNPYAIAIHPSGRYLYAGSWQTNSLWAYHIDSKTGVLTGLAQKSFSTGGISPVSIVFNTDGTMGYVANAESASISTFQVSNNTGELSLLHTTQTRPGPWWITPPIKKEMTPTDYRIYTHGKQSNKLSLYNVHMEENTKVQRIDSLRLPERSVWALHPRRAVAYVADTIRKSITAYQLDEDKRLFAKVDQSPWPIPATPVDLKIDANGWYLYVLTKDPNKLLAFAIDYKSAALIPVSQPAHVQFTPAELLLDPAARYGYVFSKDQKRVSVFSYRQNTGALRYERIRFGSPFVLKQKSVAPLIDPGANFILSTDSEHNALGVHQIDALSGAISEIAGSPFKLNANVTKAVVHHSSRYVYVFDQAAAKLYMYSRDAVSGEIDSGHDSVLDLADKTITAITIHNDYIYLADESAHSLLIYRVNPSNGALHFLTQMPLSNKADKIMVTAVN